MKHLNMSCLVYTGVGPRKDPKVMGRYSGPLQVNPTCCVSAV